MRIDLSRLNLLERDIEDYLFDNPNQVEIVKHRFGQQRVEKWIARQFRVPSGILDLLGITSKGKPVVVEVKLGAIDAKALAQVSRYAEDIGNILYCRTQGNLSRRDVIRVAIGNTCDVRSLHEADALDVSVICFSAQLTLSLLPIQQGDGYKEGTWGIYDDLAKRDDIFSAFGPHREECRTDLENELRKIVSDVERSNGGEL